jgi:hypothetical protein
MVLQLEWPPLSPQADLNLLQHTTALPTSMGSGGFILKISFNFFTFFNNVIWQQCNFFNLIATMPQWEWPPFSPQG